MVLNHYIVNIEKELQISHMNGSIPSLDLKKVSIPFLPRILINSERVKTKVINLSTASICSYWYRGAVKKSCNIIQIKGDVDGKTSQTANDRRYFAVFYSKIIYMLQLGRWWEHKLEGP